MPPKILKKCKKNLEKNFFLYLPKPLLLGSLPNLPLPIPRRVILLGERPRCLLGTMCVPRTPWGHSQSPAPLARAQ
ncbi:hypothetical protein AB205_0015630 [Aquarana catesbeiana]|uniref:Uncharacterized protein n=1 Tax=Aquarana catesbeiana TaxID=8400 RepID=A0A2G9P1H0_AQUCT|nr:hypothetical protein AB205_0015630 [Aquarana catesbeiana]